MRAPEIVHGYIMVSRLGHPRANKAGMVLEHLLVAEAALGKPLPVGAPVHHVDNDRANNCGSNLVICQDAEYHSLLTLRTRALDACGNPAWRMCVYHTTPHRHDDIANMVVNARDRKTPRYCHRACRRAYQIKRRERLASCAS